MDDVDRAHNIYSALLQLLPMMMICHDASQQEYHHNKTSSKSAVAAAAKNAVVESVVLVAGIQAADTQTRARMRERGERGEVKKWKTGRR